MILLNSRITKIINEELRENFIHIINRYLESILYKKNGDFAQAVADNMVIGSVYGYLHTPDQWDTVMLSNMEIIKEGMMSGQMEDDLFSVTSPLHVAYSVYFLWNGTGFFEKFLNSVNSHLIQLTESYLSHFCQNKENLAYQYYSYTSGISGIACYLLEYGDRYQTYIEDILKILISVMVSSDDETARIRNQIDTIDDCIDFGFGNGLAGILFTLVKSYNQTIIVEGHLDAITQIVHTYRNYAIREDHSDYWPGILESIKTGPQTPKANIKETWGYGAIGIARVLYLAGITINDHSLSDWAQNVILEKSRMNPQEFSLINASLADGYAGLLCIFDSMYHNLDDKRYESICNQLLVCIFHSFDDSDSPSFRLKKIEMISNRISESYESDFSSISRGTPGIIMSLLAAFLETDPIFYHYIGVMLY